MRLLNRMYLPVKILDEQQADRLVNGSVHMDESEEYARIFSMVRLEYDRGLQKYKPLDAAVAKTGDTAVVLCRPDVFFARLSSSYQNMFPDRYIMGTYEDEQEVRIEARVRDDIRIVIAGTNAGPADLELGDVRDMVLKVPVDDLIQGRIPPELHREEIQRKLLACDSFPIGMTANRWGVAGEFGDIEPKKEWIAFWQQLFGEEDWTPVTRMERVVKDGVEMPRLAFYSKKNGDIVFFGRFKIELYREFPDDRTCELFQRILSLLEQKVSSEYCHMTDQYHINLGEIAEKHQKKIFRQERFDEYSEPYCLTHNLRYDIPAQKNIFGLNYSEKQWHYELHISLPPKEGACLCDKDAVMEFFTKTRKVAEEKMEWLKGGEVYERFQNL